MTCRRRCRRQRPVGSARRRHRGGDRARSGGGPTLLECQTYRHYGHSKSDPAPYRPKEEVERWLARDPLKLARARLLQEGVSEEQIAAIEEATPR